MKLRTLTYTSRADDLSDDEVERIHRSAMTLNSLDGVTGMLIYNGKQFLQIVEGAEDAIEDLVQRLRCDRRHDDIVIREDRTVDGRSFPDWTMSMTRVGRARFQACDDISRALPQSVGARVRQTIVDMTALISD